MKKLGIIFDMDGTLWDSAENVAKSWTEKIHEHGYTDQVITGADVQGVMGLPMDKLANILLTFAEPEKRMFLLDECGAHEIDYLRIHGGTLYPNLRETMEKLKEKYHLYIVSNCQSGYIEAFLDYYKFHDLFEDIQCYGDNKLQKGDNIALICERNQLDDAVYVGDIQGDYNATMQAGKKFIHAAYGFGTVDADVARIEALSDLPDVVASVFAQDAE